METRRMCPNCRAFITTRDRVCPYCNETVGPRAVEAREGGGRGLLGSFVPRANFVTVMILLVNFALYAATVLYSMRSGNDGAVFGIDGRTLFDFGASYRPAVFLGQWWRLITAGFLHGGLLHILMNSWVLFDLGAEVEQIYGAHRLMVFYFVATVCGFFASSLWSPALSVGASAGLFGLIGAMIALGVTHRGSAVGQAIRGLYVRWAVYGLLIGLLPGLHVDNAAHIGGLAGGFVTAFVAGLPGRSRSLGERFWKVASFACLAITAVSFLNMYLWFATTR